MSGLRQPAARSPARRRSGFSLVELTVAILMVAVLSLGAFWSYTQEVDTTRIVACRRDLRHLREALRLYNEDHFQTPYALNDLQGLFGRYLASLPRDPWTADYVVDPFLGRLVSRGPNGVLDTMIVGFGESPSGQASDDIIEVYEPQGILACTVGTVARLYTVDAPEAAHDVQTGVDAFAAAPDCGVGLSVSSGKLQFLRNLLTGTVPEDLAAAPAALAELRLSPDGRRYAAVSADRSSLWVGPASASAASGPSVKVFAASSGVQLSVPSWGRDGQEFALATSGGEVWRMAVSAGAQPTVLTTDAARDTVKNAPSWSSDGKWIAYVAQTAGEVHLVSPALSRDAAGVAARTVTLAFAGGDLGPVAWDPSGRKLACVAGAELWLADALDSTRRLNFTRTMSAKVTAARSLCWR